MQSGWDLSGKYLLSFFVRSNKFISKKKSPKGGWWPMYTRSYLKVSPRHPSGSFRQGEDMLWWKSQRPERLRSEIIALGHLGNASVKVYTLKSIGMPNGFTKIKKNSYGTRRERVSFQFEPSERERERESFTAIVNCVTSPLHLLPLLSCFSSLGSSVWRSGVSRMKNSTTYGKSVFWGNLWLIISFMTDLMHENLLCIPVSS